MSPHRSAGFSLVEVMVGLVLLAVTLPAGVSLVLSSTNLSEVVREDHVARIEARRQLDIVRESDFEALVANHHKRTFDIDIDGDGEPDLLPVGKAKHVGFVLVEPLAGGALAGEALRITVTVRWRAQSGERTYRLVTVACKL